MKLLHRSWAMQVWLLQIACVHLLFAGEGFAQAETAILPITSDRFSFSEPNLTESLPRLFPDTDTPTTPEYDKADDGFPMLPDMVADEGAAQQTPRKKSSLALIPAGFLRSRWAMSDPQYASKYSRGASKKNLPKKIKQASDARFVDQFSGWYVSAGLTSIGDTPNPLGSLEIGYTGYHTSYFTNRMGFVAAFNDEDFFVGGETGFRLQTPTRLAPFVGLGLFAGASSTRRPAEYDDIDNDDDSSYFGASVALLSR